MKIHAMLLVTFLGGCQLFGPAPAQPPNLNDQIGAANTAITSLAETVRLACGNTEPGGPCLSSAPINRGQVDRIKLRLTEAGILLDAASAAAPGTDVYSKLNAAQLVIAEIKQMLLDREVSL